MQFIQYSYFTQAKPCYFFAIQVQMCKFCDSGTPEYLLQFACVEHPGVGCWPAPHKRNFLFHDAVIIAIRHSYVSQKEVIMTNQNDTSWCLLMVGLRDV